MSIACLLSKFCSSPDACVTMASNNRVKCLSYFHLTLLSIVTTTAQQLGSFYGYQANSGVREALLAVNAFCDNTCSPYMSQGLVGQCFQNAINQNEVVVQLLRACTTNSGYVIYCTQQSLVQLENCVLQYSASYFSVSSAFTKNCFRDSLSVGTIDCLRMRYPRLNRLLPLGPPNYGSSFSFLNTAMYGIG